MKLLSRSFLLVAALLLALLQSCSKSGAGEAAGESSLTFRISVPTSSLPETKALWEDLSNQNENDEVALGDDFDNDLDPSTLQVAVFSADGETAILVFESLAYSELKRDEYGNPYYEYSCAMASPLASGNYVLKVLANCPRITKATDLSALEFTRSYSGDPEKLPMWGQTTFSYDASLKTNTVGNVVYMLRAVAKVHIFFDSSLEVGDLRFKSVTLGSAEKKGRVIPSTYAKNVVTGQIDEADSETNAQCVTGNAASGVAFKIDDDRKGAVLYIPESRYTSGSAEARLTCTLSDGTNDYVYPLDPGIPSFLRNHLYNLRITGIWASLALKAEVLPWTFKAAERRSAALLWMNDKVTLSGCKGDVEYKLKGAVDYACLAETNGAAPITVSLNIERPQSSSWKAELLWLEGEKNAFALAAGTNTSISGGIVTGNTETSCTFTISATNPSSSSTNKALLRITAADQYILKGGVCYSALVGKHTEEITIVQNK